MAQNRKPDTTPKIAVYGKFLRNNTVIVDDPEWCYTEWIECDLTGQIAGQGKALVDAYASLFVRGSPPHSYQYELADGTLDYYYGSEDFSEDVRTATTKNIVRIRWSLLIANIDKCYAYLRNTGQIFFAGKNSIYYGHRNISELN